MNENRVNRYDHPRHYDHKAYLAKKQQNTPQWEQLDNDAPLAQVDRAPLTVQPMPVNLPAGVSAKQSDTAISQAQATGIRFRYVLGLGTALGFLIALLGWLFGLINGIALFTIVTLFGTVVVGIMGFIKLNAQDHDHSVPGIERQRGQIMEKAIDHQAEINHAIIDNDRQRVELDHEYRMEKMHMYQKYLRGDSNE